MARPLRIEYPGAYYHVMNRGNRREDIFLTDKDRQVFLDGLADSCEIYSIKLITYVLMSNHFHLLVQTPQANLSEFMRHFLVIYTVRFNRRNGRAGLKSNRKLKNQFHRIREQINKLSNSKI
jgi:REP element-mobilizing transposase RayT